MGLKFLVLVFGIFLISSAYAMSDTAVFQGQYFEGTDFQTGTYEFKFDIYTGEIFGDLVDSHTKTVTTGNWGEWRVELDGVSVACNDTSKDYFMGITIDGNVQSPRRRLTHFNYIRKDVDETTTGDLTISSILNFLSGGFIQELVDRFIFSKGVEVQGALNVTGTIKSGEKLVCLEDGTNCLFGIDGTNGTNGIDGIDGVNGTKGINGIDGVNGSDGAQGIQGIPGVDGINGIDGIDGVNGTSGSRGGYVSFISTVDGDLKKNIVYLGLGTDAGVSKSSSEMSWIIDRDLTIAGILWNANINERTDVSEIILMKSTSNKNSFLETDLSVDIQGVTSGSDNSFGVSFAQGDLAVIKYGSSGDKKDKIGDLSVTLIGTYD